MNITSNDIRQIIKRRIILDKTLSNKNKNESMRENLKLLLCAKSGRNGIGVFALKKIPKGTIVWEHTEDDVIISRTEFDSLSPKLKKVIDKQATWDDKEHTRIIIYGGLGKFWNHSCDTNTKITDDGLKCIAIRDIHRDEEVTCDYNEIHASNFDFKCNCGSDKCISKEA